MPDISCATFDTKEDYRMAEEWDKKEAWKAFRLDPDLQAKVEKMMPEISENLERGEKRWDRAESLGIDPKDILEPEVAFGDTKELIANADPDTVIISHGPEVPIFATDFKDTGQELSKSIKDYPKDLPEVKVYTPVLPTKENLSRMLGLESKNGTPLAPFSPWGEKVNFHHYEQDPKGPLMMVEAKLHREVPHSREGLSKEERLRYDIEERPEILKTVAEVYLGKNLLKDFESAIKKKGRKL